MTQNIFLDGCACICQNISTAVVQAEPKVEESIRELPKSDHNILVIGLIILICLIITLALVIAFKKLKGNEEEPKEEEGQSTHY